MVEILGWEVRVESLQTVVEPVPRMHTVQVLPPMELEAMVEVVVVELKMYPSEMVDHQQLHPVQTALVMETREVKVGQARQRNLVAAVVVLAEQVVMLELAPVEMAATERMLSPLG
jgi:Mlc titration factor MtfA (ptsG expression regulator)